SDVTHVIVYATAPVSAVVGAFTVADQHTLHPEALWLRFQDIAGIGLEDFVAYYSDRCTGTGIAVGEVLVADTPMELKRELGISHPPQSFRYVPQDAATATLRSLKPARKRLARATV